MEVIVFFLPFSAPQVEDCSQEDFQQVKTRKRKIKEAEMETTTDGRSKARFDPISTPNMDFTVDRIC